MKLKKSVLMVFYNENHRINTTLDEDLEEVLKKFGYRRFASGTERATGVRDLAFEKKK